MSLWLPIWSDLLLFEVLPHSGQRSTVSVVKLYTFRSDDSNLVLLEGADPF